MPRLQDVSPSCSVWRSTSELGSISEFGYSRRDDGDDVASMAWKLHAIEQMHLQTQHHVDGVGRLKF